MLYDNSAGKTILRIFDGGCGCLQGYEETKLVRAQPAVVKGLPFKPHFLPLLLVRDVNLIFFLPYLNTLGLSCPREYKHTTYRVFP